MDAINRRQFIGVSAGAALGAALGRGEAQVTRRSGRKIGPNETINIAIIGVNGRGMNHVSAFVSKPNGGESPTAKGTQIVTVCDCDSGVIGRAMKTIEEAQGKAPKFEQDLRRVLDDPNIDVVSIATTNHWHSLAGIWACQAGKDVYVEKPVSHNVWEGRQLVEAARKYNRIVQAGTQCRSMEGLREGIEYVHSGKLGKVYMAKGLCYKSRASIGKVDKDQTPPSTCDYNLWLGPAPMKPVHRQKFHYDWHWQWDYGNGDLGNQGIHQMDIARWGLGKNGFPKTVASSGGRYGYTDDGETPNTQSALFEYDDCLLQFEVRGLLTNEELGVKIGVLFYGSEGVLAIPSYDSYSVYDKKGEKVGGNKKGGDHFGNFIKAVRSRNRAEQNGEIEEGHLSSALCHLANISYRTGRKLKIDPKTESFIGDEEANKLLTRNYRAPFVVPDKV